MELIAGAGQALLGIVAVVCLLVGVVFLGCVICMAVAIIWYGEPLNVDEDDERSNGNK